MAQPILSYMLLASFFFYLNFTTGVLAEDVLEQQHAHTYFTINGFVKDSSSGEALIGASVIDLFSGTGATTNHYGFYSLTLASDTVRLVCSYTGYQRQSHHLFLSEDANINFRLSGKTVLEEILVEGYRYQEPLSKSTQMGTIHVPIKQISAAPALLGEVDIFKVLQLLPGIQSGSEGSSGLFVRGGTPDQNLILLDDVPVYNASHLFGFFSVFNPDAINHVNIIKGGFPAEYGGRLSSVIDVSMKEGNNQKFRGQGSVGLVSSRLTLEGPIQKGKSSFLISGRRTYIDALAGLFSETLGLDQAGYFFHDLSAKVNYKVNDRNHIFISAYHGRDRAQLADSYSVPTRDSEIASTSDFDLSYSHLSIDSLQESICPR